MAAHNRKFFSAVNLICIFRLIVTIYCFTSKTSGLKSSQKQFNVRHTPYFTDVDNYRNRIDA